MTEERFSALTMACDRLLRAPDATLERVAIPWLHVLNQHPNNLRQYSRVLTAGDGALADLRSTLVERARVIRTIGRSLRPRRPYRLAAAAQSESLKPPSRVDLLVVSHLVHSAQLANADDFYYGPLQSVLAAGGTSSLLVLLNQMGGDEVPLMRAALRGGAMARLLLPRTLGFRAEVNFLRRAHLAAQMLKGIDASDVSVLGAEVAREAARRAVTAGTVTSLRLHAQVMALCRRFKPRALLVTYEGHAWERCAWHAARSVDHSIRCLGYQHTVIWRRSHAVRRSLGAGGGGWDPDVVLTVGDVTRESLARSPQLGQVRLVTYGSHRRGPTVSARDDEGQTRCLVIPDAFRTECLILFDFAISCARLLSSIQFIFRTHPLLPFGHLARRYSRFRHLPANVEVSRGSGIEDDFRRCRYALYRGSSASIYAVLAGIKVLYVGRSGELPFDPLDALEVWRENVTDPAGFAAAVAMDRARPPAERAREAEAARCFCEGYSVPLRPEVLVDLLPP